MSVDVFETAYPTMLAFERGYANDPLDPGGATLDGVTQAEYSNWRVDRHLPSQPVRLMSNDERRQIYWGEYWVGKGSPSVLANIPRPSSAIVDFDWCVNAGPARGRFYVQAAVRTVVDGDWGEKTMDRIGVTDDATLASRLLVLRAHHYHARCGSDASLKALADAGLQRVAPSPNPTQVKFLKGWLRRLRLLAEQLGLPIDPLFAKGADTITPGV